uniref:Uncharacterized protein n=1 Tax=Arundo donax TaxID=35708 RepID=A0A0A8ZW37_ARUDO
MDLTHILVGLLDLGLTSSLIFHVLVVAIPNYGVLGARTTSMFLEWHQNFGFGSRCITSPAMQLCGYKLRSPWSLGQISAPRLTAASGRISIKRTSASLST